jgi:1-aminocyclopropane-1-carboxylate deaminase/D-cysteine desulfhydrase-like pyridoxal-dependent ACC family enzyme
VAALKLLARAEGVFLDPVYTSKAMAALIAHVRSEELTPKDTVLFLHTGGATALFAYQEQLEPEELAGWLATD